MMQHAYAVLTVKSARGNGSRRISGIATTPTPDRVGDVLDSLGATFTNPIPLLWQHDQARPIGTVTLHAPTSAGITFDAELPEVTEPGPLRDRLAEVGQSLDAGLIRAVSVGSRPLDGGITIMPNGGRRFTRFEICELSLVTVPANLDATILTIKSLDAPYLAAPGPDLSRARELPRTPARRNAPPMTANEQVTQFENSRAAKVAAMSAIMGDADGATLPDDKKEHYDDLSLQVKEIDEHLTRARELERLQRTAAAPVAAPNGSAPRSIVSVKSNLAPGTAFTRVAMAVLASKGSKYEAIEYAKQWERETPEVVQYLKAAVAPGGTTDPAWAGALATVQNVTSEFIALLRPATLLGRIPTGGANGLRKIPFNASVPIQTAGGSYGWVGQGMAKPVTSLAFGSAKLEMSKAAGIVVLTEELVKVSSPAAEEIVRDDMIAGIAAFLDQQFIDPAVAYLANVHPASITNGITGTASSQHPLTDLMVLLNKFVAAKIPMRGAVLMMNESNALAMSFLTGAGGMRMFPNVTIDGGSAEGINVIVTSATGTNVILLHPPAVLYADDGGVAVDVSRDASVQMDSAPANPTDATTVLVSLWQNNLVGLRAERFINWKRAVDAGVALVTGATYPAVISPTGAPLGAPPAGGEVVRAPR